MDRALMAMTLDEEDEPFDLPDLPEYSSCEQNYFSVVGRLLNPDCQKMSNLILDMPRKWQKYDRVRGVALSQERFQFIFKTENDVEEILDKGFQTFNDWGLAIERWVDVPPLDHLQFVLLWVQIRNIPVNHYTEVAITAFGEVNGQVVEVAFDPNKSQSRGFVRVKVKFDVSKPLRKSKVFNLPRGGGHAHIEYFYEKVQKRCYSCQRLTHEQSVCPLIVKKIQDQTINKRLGNMVEVRSPDLVLKESDPLFGVLEEKQVGIHPILGRPRIAPEVLEGMRQYLMVVDGEERKIREERVKKSVLDAESSSASQKSILRLEPSPIFSRDLLKGKGLVFGYSSEDSSSQSESFIPQGLNFMSDAIKAVGPSPWSFGIKPMQVESHPYNGSVSSIPFQYGSTGYNLGLSEASFSGSKLKVNASRKRPGKNKRSFKTAKVGAVVGENSLKEGLVKGVVEKRKDKEFLERVSKAAKPNPQEIVPKEGLSKV